jgi:hypothetical protein
MLLAKTLRLSAQIIVAERRDAFFECIYSGDDRLEFLELFAFTGAEKPAEESGHVLSLVSRDTHRFLPAPLYHSQPEP